MAVGGEIVGPIFAVSTILCFAIVDTALGGDVNPV